MPIQCSRDLFGFAPVEGRRVEAAFDGGDATSDAGALLLGATDRAIGLVTRFAACSENGRVRGRSSTLSRPWSCRKSRRSVPRSTCHSRRRHSDEDCRGRT